ncbi:MAG: 16S rRNA (adenine(1518)-N(6)/adenine(1519)-N(6))-dimethyltransferase RsmA [Lachnospiraceae bacterium]|nr:16S rRNA (adenine(1518)-N(6)/adenine(1519)-N(6))-dimethyltransferase RsmA [Lachnospiraceae bacterium]
MSSLGNPNNTRDILKKYDFSILKKYGQNFLIDEGVLEKITDGSGVCKDDHVIEIGPGLGAMTQYLCEKAFAVTAVEIDKKLIPILNDTLSSYDNVTIINNDILKMDLREYIKNNCKGKNVKVVANLPYYITTPILMKLLEDRLNLKSITVMVQKEVALRMKAEAGTKDYGALSLAVNYYSKPDIIAHVPPNCFIPRPKVGSAVIKLQIYETPLTVVKDEAFMFRLIRASFNQRRKTLANALSNDASLGLDKDRIYNALSSLELNESIRGEALTLSQFANLSDILLKGCE